VPPLALKPNVGQFPIANKKMMLKKLILPGQ
jgi:hypothetical protein